MYTILCDFVYSLYRIFCNFVYSVYTILQIFVYTSERGDGYAARIARPRGRRQHAKANGMPRKASGARKWTARPQ